MKETVPLIRFLLVWNIATVGAYMIGATDADTFAAGMWFGNICPIAYEVIYRREKHEQGRHSR